MQTHQAAFDRAPAAPEWATGSWLGRRVVLSGGARDEQIAGGWCQVCELMVLSGASVLLVPPKDG